MQNNDDAYVPHENCNCDICSGKLSLDDVLKKEAQLLEEYGWYSHFVYEDDTPYQSNYHTHGLMTTVGCFDFQIVLPIDPTISHAIITTVVDMIKKDELTIVENEKYDNIIKKSKVKFVMATESDRKVWRIVFPDICGSFKNEPYNRQFIGTKYEEYYLSK